MIKKTLSEKPIQILVADDDELFLHIVRKLMEEEGFEVITAKSGYEALRIAIENSPDLIILDSNMPTISGEEICKFLKKEYNLKSIPIIIMSGLEDEESVMRFVDCGCDDYFPKSRLNNNLSSLLKDRVNKALRAL